MCILLNYNLTLVKDGIVLISLALCPCVQTFPNLVSLGQSCKMQHHTQYGHWEPTLSAGLYLTLRSSTECTSIKSVVFLVLPSSSLVFLSFVSLDHFCHWIAPLETNPSSWKTDSIPFEIGWYSGTCNSASDLVQGLDCQVSL